MPNISEGWGVLIQRHISLFWAGCGGGEYEYIYIYIYIYIISKNVYIYIYIYIYITGCNIRIFAKSPCQVVLPRPFGNLELQPVVRDQQSALPDGTMHDGTFMLGSP